MAHDVGDIAEELYALPPTRFVAARDARAKSADRATAVVVKSLRRPAPAAWIVNLLARERPADLDELLDLGADLRTAQASLDRAEMTRLAAQRRALVAAVARAGADLAADAGHPVASSVVDTVADTLDAALADPAAAEAVRTGRLLRALQSIGFEPVDLAEAVALPEAGSRAAEKRAPASRPTLRVVDDSDAELARARRRADAAVARAEEATADAARELAEAEDRLRAARRALAAAQRDADAADLARESATTAHDQAAAALDAARRARRELR